MIRSLEEMTDASVVATDGQMGKVCNFLFDDQSWMIRYVVVDVRSWLMRHDVVISINAIEQPDWDQKTFHVRLTREEVRNSPDVDSKKPVSRQQEVAMREYYGWPAYWNDQSEFPAPPLAAGREYPVRTGEDPHLRSVEEVTGYEVWATDGSLGKLENFIVDDASWHIGYLDVKMGDWLHGRSMLVPTRSVELVSWAKHRINLQQSTAGR